MLSDKKNNKNMEVQVHFEDELELKKKINNFNDIFKNDNNSRSLRNLTEDDLSKIEEVEYNEFVESITEDDLTEKEKLKFSEITYYKDSNIEDIEIDKFEVIGLSKDIEVINKKDLSDKENLLIMNKYEIITSNDWLESENKIINLKKAEFIACIIYFIKIKLESDKLMCHKLISEYNINRNYLLNDIKRNQGWNESLEIEYNLIESELKNNLIKSIVGLTLSSTILGYSVYKICKYMNVAENEENKNVMIKVDLNTLLPIISFGGSYIYGYAKDIYLNFKQRYIGLEGIDGKLELSKNRIEDLKSDNDIKLNKIVEELNDVKNSSLSVIENSVNMINMTNITNDEEISSLFDDMLENLTLDNDEQNLVNLNEYVLHNKVDSIYDNIFNFIDKWEKWKN